MVYSYMFAVDAFFFVGGFLIGFLFLKTFARKSTLSTFPLAFVQRVLRFWPCFIISILVYWKISSIVGGNGPLFYTLKTYTDLCDNDWWSDLLFVSNFRN